MATMRDSSDKSFKKFTFNQLQCSICNDIFDCPTIINCGHTFCKNCIQKWTEEKRNKSTCPICRSEIFLQAANQVLLGLIEELNKDALTKPASKMVITVTLNMDTVNFLGISIVGQSNKDGQGDCGIYVG